MCPKCMQKSTRRLEEMTYIRYICAFYHLPLCLLLELKRTNIVQNFIDDNNKWIKQFQNHRCPSKTARAKEFLTGKSASWPSFWAPGGRGSRFPQPTYSCHPHTYQLGNPTSGQGSFFYRFFGM